MIGFNWLGAISLLDHVLFQKETKTKHFVDKNMSGNRVYQ